MASGYITDMGFFLSVGGTQMVRLESFLLSSKIHEMQCGSPSIMVSTAFLRGRFNDHTQAVECIILKEQLPQ